MNQHNSTHSITLSVEQLQQLIADEVRKQVQPIIEQEKLLISEVKKLKEENKNLQHTTNSHRKEIERLYKFMDFTITLKGGSPNTIKQLEEMNSNNNERQQVMEKTLEKLANIVYKHTDAISLIAKGVDEKMEKYNERLYDLNRVLSSISGEDKILHTAFKYEEPTFPFLHHHKTTNVNNKKEESSPFFEFEESLSPQKSSSFEYSNSSPNKSPFKQEEESPMRKYKDERSGEFRR